MIYFVFSDLHSCIDELKRELRELNLSGLEYMPKESIQLFIRDKQM